MNPVELFEQDAEFVTLAPGEPLFTEGDTGEEMYVVMEGTLAIIVAGKVVESAGPGALLGELALIDKEPRAATVLARSVTKLAKIDRERFYGLVQKDPEFAIFVMKVLADRLRQMNEKLMQERMSK